MRWLLALALFAPACGGDNDPSGPCAPRTGLFRQTMAKMSGSCADLPERVYNADTSDEAGCTGPVTTSEDGCEETADRTCMDADAKTTVVSRGKVKWNPAGTHGAGTLYLNMTGPAGSCSAIYNMTLARL